MAGMRSAMQQKLEDERIFMLYLIALFGLAATHGK